MSFKTSTITSIIVASCLLVSSSEAQLVKQLGRLPFVGKVQNATFLGAGCDSCAAGPSSHLQGCADPACGCAAPSCGLAGSILGSCLGGGPGCGLPEPSCGSTGLGYGGGFGLCGGSCDSCGDGGYMGRNLRKVSPCACGGSLIGDLARGLISLVDRAVGTAVTTFFGGLQKVTCHANGTLAALQCAAAAACNTCGTIGCDGGCYGGPACGLPASDCGCAITPSCGAPACGAPTSLASPMTYATPEYHDESYPATSYPGDVFSPSIPNSDSGYSQPTPPTPTPTVDTDTVPLPQVAPTMAPVDPFLDDPVLPQAQRQMRARPTGFRVFGQSSASQTLAQTARPNGTANQATPLRSVRTASHASPQLKHRYLQGRQATLRR